MITSVTIRAYPSFEFVVADIFLGTIPGNEGFWDAIAYILTRFPELDAQGIGGYSFIVPGYDLSNTTSANSTSAYATSSNATVSNLVNVYSASFNLPILHPSNTSASLAAALNKVLSEALAPYPGQFVSSVTIHSYSDFWEWYSVNNGPLDGGHDQVLGSRLLDGKALANQTALRETYKSLADAGIVSVYLVGGKNVMNAKPRGGGNAVNSAWRKAYVHTREYLFFRERDHVTDYVVLGTRWNPFDVKGQAVQRYKLTNVWVEAFRKLAPDMGAYINEVCIMEAGRK